MMLSYIPSPPQGVWHIGPVPLRAYALLIIAGIVVGVLWGDRRLVARGGRRGSVTDLALWMVPFGLVGGRLYHVITNPELYFAAGRDPWRALAIWEGGLGIWGAIALGALGAYLGARRMGIPFGAVADALAPAIVLAQGIGRLGNYFNQELFGGPTTLPWGLEVYLRTPGGVAGEVAQCGTGEFPPDWMQADPTVLCGVYHPTFLYELLWNIGVALLVVVVDRKLRLGRGRAFALYVVGYTAGRTWIELMRTDYANHFFGVRVNVFVSLAVLLAAAAFLALTRGWQREDPASVAGRAPDDKRDGEPDDEPDGESNEVSGGDAVADESDESDAGSVDASASGSPEQHDDGPAEER